MSVLRAPWTWWVALRAWLVAIILGAIPWPEQVNDLAIYARWAQGPLAAGTYPDDPMWQYPPLAGPVFLLGEWLPGGRFGFVLLFLACDAAIMTLLHRHARATGLTQGVWLWALAALITGPLLLARFDVVPTLAAVGAVLAARSRPGLSGALAAVGAWLKVWPALMIAAVARRDLPRALLAAVAASVTIGALLLVATTDPFGFLGGQASRGLQIESVAAWPFLIARAAGADVDVVYQFGAHEVVSGGVGAVADVAVVATLVLLGVLAVQRLRGALDGHLGADVALTTVLVAVATSRVFSGQYFIWLLALAAVCLGEQTTRLRTPVRLLIAAGAATQLVYPWLYTALLEGHPAALVVQTMRVLLTVAATVLAMAAVLGPLPRGRDPRA